MPYLLRTVSVPTGGIGVSRIVAQIGRRQVSASTRYNVDRSTHFSRIPASSGPTIAPNCITVMLSELAAATCSAGRIRGIAADRVGELTAKNACWNDSRQSTTHTLFSARAACSQRNTDATASPTEAMMSNTRRSIASASAPPHNPNTTSGTRAKTPESPT